MNARREIIFRGKSAEFGRWYEGHLFEILGESFIELEMPSGIPNRVKVIPQTVSQYTGLTDRNNRRIFENDIVEYQLEPDGTPIKDADKRIVGRVFFSEWRASFSVTAGHDLNMLVNNDLFKYIRRGNCVEVVGNIYDDLEISNNGGEPIKAYATQYDAKSFVLTHLSERSVLEGLSEECCELAQAALKHIRAEDGENPTPATPEECKAKLHEEAGDVLMYMEILGLVPKGTTIDNPKWGRWKKRLMRAGEGEQE